VEELKEYIESGILELYVLGQVTAQEQIEVEEMMAKYPEVKQEIKAIEFAMEQYALLQAIQPAPGLQDKILEKISRNNDQEAVIVPLHNPAQQSRISMLRFGLAASLILLAGSLIALFSARNELNTAKEQIASLNLEKEKFTTTVNFMKQTNADLQKIAEISNSQDWKTVKLSGTKMDPTAKMTVYWNSTGHHVMIDNSKLNLPANDEAHQYQLWALVDGKPVDLGVFDVKTNVSQILLKMNNIAAAQTFAVTLEKRGGSATPTMDQMIVAGNISG
jgi:anti-sigma-K factor RskA